MIPSYVVRREDCEGMWPSARDPALALPAWSSVHDGHHSEDHHGEKGVR